MAARRDGLLRSHPVTDGRTSSRRCCASARSEILATLDRALRALAAAVPPRDEGGRLTPRRSRASSRRSASRRAAARRRCSPGSDATRELERSCGVHRRAVRERRRDRVRRRGAAARAARRRRAAGRRADDARALTRAVRVADRVALDAFAASGLQSLREQTSPSSSRSARRSSSSCRRCRRCCSSVRRTRRCSTTCWRARGCSRSAPVRRASSSTAAVSRRSRGERRFRHARYRAFLRAGRRQRAADPAVQRAPAAARARRRR